MSTLNFPIANITSNLPVVFERLLVFERLSRFYLAIGLTLVLIILAGTFINKNWVFWMRRVMFIHLQAGLAVHTFAGGLEWYFSGEAPWDSCLGSLIYFTCTGMMAAALFSKRSVLPISVFAIISGVLLHYNAALCNETLSGDSVLISISAGWTLVLILIFLLAAWKGSSWVYLERIPVWLELGKIKITAAVSTTTFTGYLLKTASLHWELLLVIPGIFMLASGASAFTHIQESPYDKQMERTKQRPLPSGRISRGGAWRVALVYSFSGSLLLLAGSGITGLALGLFAFFWYNILYTYLKRITAWAVLPGSLIGSIPPLIGWVTAGGELADPEVIPIAAFFFIWQVPHFLLLVLKYGGEYESAGFSSLSSLMPPERIGRMIFFWIIITAFVTVILTFTGPLNSPVSKWGL